MNRLRDYLALTKPEITFMNVAVALGGFYLGSAGHVDLTRLANTLAGVTLGAAGTGALNMFFERVADGRMRRTRLRPLPAGRLAPWEALAVGAGAVVAGIAYLAWRVNVLSALLLTLAVANYLFAYTALKPRTHACVLVGALSGAAPPLIGWVAATGRINGSAGVLFLILFLWQIPHFLALAWLHREDYASIGWRMLPTNDPAGRKAGRQVVGYGAALLLASLLPWGFSLVNPAYLIGAAVVGALFLVMEVRFAIQRTTTMARTVFIGSMVYLPAIFGLLAVHKL